MIVFNYATLGKIFLFTGILFEFVFFSDSILEPAEPAINSFTSDPPIQASMNKSQHRSPKTSRMIWTDYQRKKALTFFKKEISSFKVPGKERCTEFICNNPEMRNVHWKKVKQFVHNYLNKIRKYSK